MADKCGGVTVLRAPADADAAGDAAAGGAARALLGEAAGGGAAALAPVARYHVGDVVTALRRAALGAGGAEVVAYATVSGAVGALAPSPSRDDRDFFAHLEMHVRQERLAPTGRDHASYRSSYAPAKDVADGDLCAEFLALPADARRRRRRRPRPHAGGRRQEAGGRAEPVLLVIPLPLLLSIPPELTSLANPRDGQEVVYKLELQVETPTTGGPTRRLGPKSYTGARRRGEGELRARRARS